MAGNRLIPDFIEYRKSRRNKLGPNNSALVSAYNTKNPQPGIHEGMFQDREGNWFSSSMYQLLPDGTARSTQGVPRGPNAEQYGTYGGSNSPYFGQFRNPNDGDGGGGDNGGGTAEDQGFDINSLFDTGGSGGGSTYEPNYVYFNGQRYDLSDPSQADAYYGAQRDAYIAEAQQGSRSALEEASRTYGQNLLGLNQDIEQLGRLQEEYGRGSARQITDLGQGYDLGTVRRGQYFSGLSPRAYQSSQGSGQLFAQGKLQQGVGDVTSALEEANRQFNLQREGLSQERSNMEYGYNQFTKGQEDYLTRAQRAAEDYYNTQGANAFDIGTPGAFSYSRNKFDPYQAKQVDLGAYTPYTEFNNLPGAGAGSQPGGGYTGTYKPGTGYGGIEGFLGYTPGQDEQNLLDRYLKLGY